MDAKYRQVCEALQLMLDAAQDADDHGELYDSFDAELLDMAQEALEGVEVGDE